MTERQREQLEAAAVTIWTVREDLHTRDHANPHVVMLDDALTCMAAADVIIPNFADEERIGKKARRKR